MQVGRWHEGLWELRIQDSSPSTDTNLALGYQGATSKPKLAFRLLYKLLERELDINEVLGALLVGESLYLAASEGNDSMVDALIEAGANANTVTDVSSETPLHAAAAGGHLSVARTLLDNGASVGEILYLAASEGNDSMVDTLIKAGANANTVTDVSSGTPLHAAAAGGHLSVARILLENGASVVLETKLGHTPLHIAAAANRLKVVQMLLEHGANPKATAKDGSIPLHKAQAAGHSDVMQLLESDVNANANANAAAKGEYAPQHAAAAEGDDGHGSMGRDDRYHALPLLGNKRRKIG